MVARVNTPPSDGRPALAGTRMVWRATLAILVAGLCRATAAAAAPPATRPAVPIEALWVWPHLYTTDAGAQDRLLDFCQRQGFDRLLVQVPWAAPARPAATGPATRPASPPPSIADPAGFARLIAEAAKRHVAVEALDGAADMGQADQRPHTLATVNAIVAFNRTLLAGSRLVGLHWYIAPYVLPDWKRQATRPRVETDYLQMLADTRRALRAAGSDLTLATDIAWWYAAKTTPGDDCTVTFDGRTQNFHRHIQDLTDYVGILSFRPPSPGADTLAAAVAAEQAYAGHIGKFVCPALETTELTETPQISFFGRPAAAFQAERHAAESTLAARPGYGGLIVNNYPAVVAILEPDRPAK